MMERKYYFNILNKYSFFIVVSLGMLSGVNAQDPIFSQYFMAPSTMNPAYAGQNSGPNFSLLYRNQWPTIEEGVYTTYLLNYNQFFDGINSGIGLTLSSDDQGGGVLVTQSIDVDYAYRLQTRGGWNINLGLSIGADMKRLNWDKLVFYDQLDPEHGAVLPGGITIPTQELEPLDYSKIALDVGFGVTAYNKDYHVGFSMQHLNQPKIDFIEVNKNTYPGYSIRYNIMAGTQFNLDKRGYFIAPNVLASFQGAHGQINVGAYVGLGNLFTGIYYRHAISNPDAVILNAGMKIKQFRFGYAYDFTVSDIAPNHGGTHELGLSVNINQPERKYIDCYGFFR